jgi:hypothetical protein
MGGDLRQLIASQPQSGAYPTLPIPPEGSIPLNFTVTPPIVHLLPQPTTQS